MKKILCNTLNQGVRLIADFFIISLVLQEGPGSYSIAGDHVPLVPVCLNPQ